MTNSEKKKTWETEDSSIPCFFRGCQCLLRMGKRNWPEVYLKDAVTVNMLTQVHSLS